MSAVAAVPFPESLLFDVVEFIPQVLHSSMRELGGTQLTSRGREDASNVSNGAGPYGLDMGSKAVNTVIPVQQETMAFFGCNGESTERGAVFDLPVDEGISWNDSGNAPSSEDAVDHKDTSSVAGKDSCGMDQGIPNGWLFNWASMATRERERLEARWVESLLVVYALCVSLLSPIEAPRQSSCP